MHLSLNQKEDQLYFKSPIDGKMIKIVVIVIGIDDANEYMTENPNLGVIFQATEGFHDGQTYVFLADVNDEGIPIAEIFSETPKPTPFVPSCISCGRKDLSKSEMASGLLCESCETNFVKEYIDEELPDIPNMDHILRKN